MQKKLIAKEIQFYAFYQICFTQGYSWSYKYYYSILGKLFFKDQLHNQFIHSKTQQIMANKKNVYIWFQDAELALSFELFSKPVFSNNILRNRLEINLISVFFIILSNILH